MPNLKIKPSGLTHVYDDHHRPAHTTRLGLVQAHKRAKSHHVSQDFDLDGQPMPKSQWTTRCGRQAGLAEAEPDWTADPRTATCAACQREAYWPHPPVQGPDDVWYRQWSRASIEDDREFEAEMAKIQAEQDALANRPGWVQGRETLRTDYAEGAREDGDPEQFPLYRTNPVLVLGYEADANKVFAYSAKHYTDVQEGLALALKTCERDTIRLIGTWPGQWDTDQFELNVDQYLALTEDD